MMTATLPQFDQFSPADVAPTIKARIASLREAIAVARKAPPTWDEFYLPLAAAGEALEQAWGIVSHLNAVADSTPLREAYEAMLPEVTQVSTEMAQDVQLYEQYKRLASSSDFQNASATRKRVVEKALQAFQLGGAELVSPQRERFAQIQEELAVLAQKFSKNVLDATNQFSHLVTDPAQMAGLPDDVVQAAKEAAKAQGKEGWLLNLRAPCYIPVLQYAHDRKLRELMYKAYVTRASAGALDNAPTIDAILKLRREQAQLLGYPDFAAVSLATKMASSPTEVLTFLRDLARRAKPFAQREFNELVQFAQTDPQFVGQTLQPWDVAYYAEKLKQRDYAFSDQEVRQYFQAPRVLQGLFGLAERLFKVKIEPDHTSTWHESVEFYKITRQDPQGHSVLVGQFYLDLYARENKRSGAWADAARGRHWIHGKLQTPVAYLVCNFMPPASFDPGSKPALLTHAEVITLFHEMGHGLHHLLTEVNELAVSGINGVEWDAVELPSQFMENFCWEWDVVRSMSAHIDSGEPLPEALFQKMLRAKKFHSAMGTVRQLEFGLFDMLIHHQAEGTADTVQGTLDAVRKEVAVVHPPAYNRFQNSFSHIFSGGYAAGYYSYKWAEVLSADCYAAFEEAPQKVSETGERFLKEILSKGGSRPAIDSFTAFRGRAPQLDALLRHNGLEEIPASVGRNED